MIGVSIIFQEGGWYYDRKKVGGREGRQSSFLFLREKAFELPFPILKKDCHG